MAEIRGPCAAASGSATDAFSDRGGYWDRAGTGLGQGLDRQGSGPGTREP